MSELRIELKGRRIGTKQVPIDVLGKVLSGLNNLLRDISSTFEKAPKKPKERKEFYKSRQLYVTGITGGASTIIELKTEAQEALPGKMKPAILPLQKALEGFEIIQIHDEDQAYKQIQNLYPNDIGRVRVLGDYRGVWRVPSVSRIRRAPEVEVAITSTDPLLKSRVEIKPDYSGRIDSWLRRELGTALVTYQGLITRIKADGTNRYFTLIDEKNKAMECELIADKESEILGLFKVPVVLKGIITQIRNKRKVRKITDISRLESLTITPEEFSALTESIELYLEYNTIEDFWIAENEELGLRAVGNSLEELKSEVLILLDFMVDAYLIQQPQPETLSPELRTAVDKLRKVVDITQHIKNDHWKFEGER